jgi:hypothetical protein
MSRRCVVTIGDLRSAADQDHRASPHGVPAASVAHLWESEHDNRPVQELPAPERARDDGADTRAAAGAIGGVEYLGCVGVLQLR